MANRADDEGYDFSELGNVEREEEEEGEHLLGVDDVPVAANSLCADEEHEQVQNTTYAETATLYSSTSYEEEEVFSYHSSDAQDFDQEEYQDHDSEEDVVLFKDNVEQSQIQHSDEEVVREFNALSMQEFLARHPTPFLFTISSKVTITEVLSQPLTMMRDAQESRKRKERSFDESALVPSHSSGEYKRQRVDESDGRSTSKMKIL